MKKAAVWILTLIVLLTGVLGAEAFDLTDTYEMAKKDGPRVESISVAAGDSLGVQVRSRVPLRSVAFELGAESDAPGKRVIRLSVFAWDRNARISSGNAPLCETVAEDWLPGEKTVLDPEQITGSCLPAGEYYFRLVLEEGPDVTVRRYYPSPMGVHCFFNERFDYGSFPGTLTFAEKSENPVWLVSDETDVVYCEVPPKYQLPEDSAIVRKNVDASKWAGTDGLGRTLPGNQGELPKKERYVGMFYWTWHLQNGGQSDKAPNNIHEIIKQYPEILHDYHNEIWNRYQGSNFWNEPLWGYYTETDDYVLRKHGEMLADAGVDFVVFDCTNGDAVWTPAYMNLLKVWDQARKDGVRTPQIVFMFQLFGYDKNTGSSLSQVYNTLYKKGLYQDQWFYWEGKPLIMSPSSGLDRFAGEEAEIAHFFTFREGVASYFGPDSTDDYWGWLHVYPQALYKNEDGSVEMTTVGVSMNANYETKSLSAMNSGKNMGRSYTAKKRFSYSYRYQGRRITASARREDSKLYGLNFQEQWDYALSVDPEIVFVTGWNEWIMGRYENWCGVDNAFPDEFDDENSRDIEPSKGDLKDHYYYQLVANVRRFKGASEPDYQPRKKTMDITAGREQWEDPAIVTNNHYAGNTLVRDAKGFGGIPYQNPGLRNDFVCAKVSYDAKNLYFFVETAEDITPFTDENWMRLLLDTVPSRKKSRNWEEFEYLLNREGADGDTLVLERSKGGWNWEPVGRVKYTVSGNVMQVEIPRSLLKLKGNNLNFRYKWCDANLADGDIMTLYTDGDAAPGGRFTFVFATGPAKKPLSPILIAGGAILPIAAVFLFFLVGKRKKAKNRGTFSVKSEGIG